MTGEQIEPVAPAGSPQQITWGRDVETVLADYDKSPESVIRHAVLLQRGRCPSRRFCGLEPAFSAVASEAILVCGKCTDGPQQALETVRSGLTIIRNDFQS